MENNDTALVSSQNDVKPWGKKPVVQWRNLYYYIADASRIHNPFVLKAPFLYPPETSQNRKVFWRFQRVEKGCLGKESIKIYNKGNA